VPPELEDKDIGTKIEHILDELPCGEGVAVLGKTVDKEKGNTEERLTPGLGNRAKASEDERPTIGGFHLNLLRGIKGGERNLVNDRS
jgi:hypothetical protein